MNEESVFDFNLKGLVERFREAEREVNETFRQIERASTQEALGSDFLDKFDRELEAAAERVEVAQEPLVAIQQALEVLIGPVAHNQRPDLDELWKQWRAAEKEAQNAALNLGDAVAELCYASEEGVESEVWKSHRIAFEKAAARREAATAERLRIKDLLLRAVCSQDASEEGK